MFSNGVKHFEDQFFFVTPSIKRLMRRYMPYRHEYSIDVQVCFTSLGTNAIFLPGNVLYVYKDNDMLHEEFHLEKRIVTFSKELGYARGIVS